MGYGLRIQAMDWVFFGKAADNFCDSCKISHEKSSVCSNLLHMINMFKKLKPPALGHFFTKVSRSVALMS